MIAATESNDADMFVLLFSADWFAPYWHLLGLHVRHGDAEAFRDAMRKAAGDLLGCDEDYFQISFEAMRVSATRDKWRRALEAFAAPTGRMELLVRDCHSRSAQTQAKVELRAEHYLEWEELKHLEDATLTETEWDRWLAKVTAGVPDLLRTYAWSVGYA